MKKLKRLATKNKILSKTLVPLYLFFTDGIHRKLAESHISKNNLHTALSHYKLVVNRPYCSLKSLHRCTELAIKLEDLELARQAISTIRNKYPSSAKLDLLSAQIAELSGDNEAAKNYWLEALKSSSCQHHHLFRAAKFFTKIGMSIEAHQLLEELCLNQPERPKYFIALARSHYDSLDFTNALINANKACELNKFYALPQRLSLEIDIGNQEQAAKTVKEICKFPIEKLREVFQVVNRAEGFLNTGHPEIIQARKKLFEHIDGLPEDNAKEITSKINAFYRNKCITQAHQLATKHQNQIKPSLASTIKASFHSLGEIRAIVDAACKNERSLIAEQVYFIDGQEVKNPQITKEHLLIEFFIPKVFFNQHVDQKDTYEQIREVFRGVYQHIVQLQQPVILLPRIQYNWRYITPRSDGLVISYHTTSEQPAINIQESVVSKHVSIDPNGFAGFSSLTKLTEQALENYLETVSPKDINQSCQALLTLYLESNQSKYTQKSTATSPLITGNYIFIPLQVQTDSVAALAQVNGLELLEKAINDLEGTDYKIVVKRHPYCKSWKVQQRLQQLSEQGLIVQSSASVHLLISRAAAVVTVNSGTGFEALVHNKPVYIFGKCDYGLAAHKLSPDETIAPPFKAPSNITKRFIYYYIEFYLNHYKDNGCLQRAIASSINLYLAGSQLKPSK